MKKIIVLACLLVLVAALVVPMMASAATTPIGGTVKYASVLVTAPKAIAFSTFVQGWNFKGDTTALTMGNVKVTAGTSGTIDATVTAKSAPAEACLFNESRQLDKFFLISLDPAAYDEGVVVGDWYIVNGGTGDVVVGEDTYSFAGAATTNLSAADAAPGTIATLTFPLWTAQYITEADATTGAGTYSIVVEFTAICLP